MKTDRELLELAAKAAGIKYHSYIDHEMIGRGINIGDLDSAIWNPLADDGDALRLAVECSLTIDLSEEKVLVEAPWLTNEFSEDYANDKMRATRRAIVRAAAAIGEQMP